MKRIGHFPQLFLISYQLRLVMFQIIFENLAQRSSQKTFGASDFKLLNLDSSHFPENHFPNWAFGLG